MLMVQLPRMLKSSSLDLHEDVNTKKTMSKTTVKKTVFFIFPPFF